MQSAIPEKRFKKRVLWNNNSDSDSVKVRDLKEHS